MDDKASTSEITVRIDWAQYPLSECLRVKEVLRRLNENELGDTLEIETDKSETKEQESGQEIR